MAELINFGKKVSLEEFIKAQVCANNGTCTRAKRSGTISKYDRAGDEGVTA